MGACLSSPQGRREAPAAAGGGTAQPVAAACPTAAAPPAQPVAREAAQEARGGSAEVQQQSGLPSDSPVVQSDVAIAVAQACPDLAPASSGPAVFVTPHESERLQALRALNVLNCPHERFSTITRLIKELFSVPLAAVVAIDEHLHIISPQGDLSYKEGAPRALSFCQWVLAGDSPTVLVVEDALKDRRFKDTPHVAGPPHIRFFAGAPLISSNGGHRFGSLAIMDFRPRQFQASQLVLLAHFAELTVREMEQELALKWQQQALDRQQASQLHLVRALDCFHEGVLLLDLAGPQWRMVWCNEAFRSAAGMPQLLAGAAGSSGVVGAMQQHAQDAAAKGRAAEVPEGADFWHLFEHVADVSPGSYNAALLALREGRDFTLRLQPNPDALDSGPGSSSADGSGSANAAASGSQQRPLTLMFRPAESDQLLAGEQVIGIPAMRMRTSGDGSSVCSDADAHDHDRVTSSTELQPNTPNGAVDRPAARAAPLYYFAIVQKQEAAGNVATALGERPPADPRSLSCSEIPPFSPLMEDMSSMAFRSFDGVSMGAAMATGGRQPLSWPGPEGWDRSASNVQTLGPSAGPGQVGFPVSAFYRLRPDVMKEVTLGTLIGTGSMGRCYRGMWQGGRVAVKIIDCISEPESVGTSGPLASAELPSGSSRAPSGGSGLSSKRPTRGMCAQAAVVEALLARSMGHPHIVTTFAHGVGVEEQVEGGGASHQQVWIVQEFCNRGSLFEAVDRGMLQLSGGTGPDLRAVLATAQEIAGALTYLHAHDVLHGDLTPSNVLLTSSTKDGRRWQAKVNDFGLSAVMGGADAVRRSCRLGTVTHMPPEVVQHGTLSKATDVWSFGMIVLEMVTGQRAYMGLHYGQIIRQVGEGQLPMSIPSDLPPGLASLIRRCLSYKPADRPDFPTILAEVQQLKDALYSRPASQEASRPEMGSPQQQAHGSGRPRSQPPQPQQLSAEEKEQHRARQRQLIREQEAWMARQRDPSAAAGAQKPTVVFPAARAPSLPSPFAAAPAPAPSLASPFAAAPERAPSLPQPAGAQ